MLVLSCKFGGAIMIGDKIKLTAETGKGKQVKIHIEAPKELKILRGELQNKNCGGRDS